MLSKAVAVTPVRSKFSQGKSTGEIFSSEGRDSLPPVRWLAAALVCVTITAFANSFRGAWVFDDFPSILENPGVQSFRSFFHPALDPGNTTAGRPFLRFSFALNYLSGGRAIRGYHLVNLGIHVAAALALFGVVRRILLCTAPDFPARRAAWVAAAIAAAWAVHPLQTESVTYIAQRAESLAGLLYLLTVYGFIRLGGRAGQAHTDGFRGWTIFTVAVCALGMATKEVMATAPVVVLILDGEFYSGSMLAAWKNRRAFYLSLAATWMILAVEVASSHGRGSTVGAGGATLWWAYALTQSRAIVHYVRLAVWPSPLIFDYGRAVVTDGSEAWPQLLTLFLLASISVMGWRLRKGWGLLGVIFFLLLAPSSSAVPIVTQTIAEHRMYLSLACLMAGVVLLLVKWRSRIAIVAISLVVLGEARATWARNEVYSSELSLWADVTQKNPSNPRAWLNLGIASQKAGQIEEAIRDYGRATALAPVDFEPHLDLALAHDARGDAGSAEKEFLRALQIRPESVRAHYGLGMIYVHQRRLAAAVPELAAAARLDSDSAPAQANLGSVLCELQNFPAALPHLEKAVQLAPAAAAPRLTLAFALWNLQRPDEAKAIVREVLRADPDNSRAQVMSREMTGLDR